jgi:hypothetical protein
VSMKYLFCHKPSEEDIDKATHQKKKHISRFSKAISKHSPRYISVDFALEIHLFSFLLDSTQHLSLRFSNGPGQFFKVAMSGLLVAVLAVNRSQNSSESRKWTALKYNHYIESDCPPFRYGWLWTLFPSQHSLCKYIIKHNQ